jgi:hypothetical protein
LGIEAPSEVPVRRKEMGDKPLAQALLAAAE